MFSELENDHDNIGSIYTEMRISLLHLNMSLSQSLIFKIRGMNPYGLMLYFEESQTLLDRIKGLFLGNRANRKNLNITFLKPNIEIRSN